MPRFVVRYGAWCETAPEVGASFARGWRDAIDQATPEARRGAARIQ